MHKQKWELNISQITLVKIIHLGRHEIVNTRTEHCCPRVKGSNPVTGSFLTEFNIYLIIYCDYQ